MNDLLSWLMATISLISLICALCTVAMLARNQRRINETRQLIERNWEYIEKFRPGARAQFYAENPHIRDHRA